MNRHTNKFHTKIRDKKDKPMNDTNGLTREETSELMNTLFSLGDHLDDLDIMGICGGMLYEYAHLVERAYEEYRDAHNG